MCGGGGGGGQREATQEERDLWAAQKQSIDQGLRGRDIAMGSYQGFINRGRELGSTENLALARDKFLETGLAASATADKMAMTKMASRGVNVGDTGGMANAMLGNKVDTAAALAGGSNDAANKQRSIGLQLESAGTAGMAGFDPSSSMSSLAQSLDANSRSSIAASQASAQGWGQLASAGMYGLKNYDDISKGVGKAYDTVSGWFAADGGEVPDYAQGGIVRPVKMASGGNVYDQAVRQQAAMMPQPSNTRAGPQPGMSPGQATAMAAQVVGTASKFLGPKAGSTAGIQAPAGAGEMMGVSAPGAGTSTMGGAAGSGITPGAAGTGIQAPAGWGTSGLANAGAATGEAAAGGTAAAEGAAAAGTAAAEGAAATGAAAGTAGTAALSAIGTAMPWVGAGLLAANALGLFKADGGEIAPGIGRSSAQPMGRAENPEGGSVRGPGGPKDDKVPAWLSPGEFVMPVEAVQKYGIDRLENMRRKALNPDAGRRAR